MSVKRTNYWSLLIIIMIALNMCIYKLCESTDVDLCVSIYTFSSSITAHYPLLLQIWRSKVGVCILHVVCVNVCAYACLFN